MLVAAGCLLAWLGAAEGAGGVQVGLPREFELRGVHSGDDVDLVIVVDIVLVVLLLVLEKRLDPETALFGVLLGQEAPTN